MDYYKRFRTISWILFVILLLLMLGFTFYSMHRGWQRAADLAPGLIMLVTFPVLKTIVMLVLNHMAKKRGDQKPFGKDAFCWFC